MDEKTKKLIQKDAEGSSNKNWHRLFEEASNQLLRFFKNPSPDDMPKVKVATSILSSFTRHEQTESARDQTAVIIARHMSDNKEDFAKYLEISNPKLSLLTEGK